MLREKPVQVSRWAKANTWSENEGAAWNVPQISTSFSRSILGCTPGFFAHFDCTPLSSIRWRGIPQLRVVGPDRVRSAGDLGRLARWLAAPVGNYWRTVVHGRPSHRPMVPACDRTLRRAFAPGPPPPPHTAAKTSREPCDQHRLRCTEKMRRPARTRNRLGRFWSTRVRARAKAVFWKSRTVRRNIWRRFFSPVWFGSSVSHLGSQSIHAPHSREQQTHHRHLDQCFAGLHLPLVVLAHSSLSRKPAQRSFHHPSARSDTELDFVHFGGENQA